MVDQWTPSPFVVTPVVEFSLLALAYEQQYERAYSLCEDAYNSHQSVSVRVLRRNMSHT